MNKILWFIAGFLLFILTSSQAQHSKKTKEKDFVINLKRDTIYGKIVGNRTPALLSVQVSFIDDKTSTRTVYKAHQIKSWHPKGADYYFESKEYRPVGRNPKELGLGVYMKCLTPYKGTVRLYEYYNTDQTQGRTQVFLERRGKMVEVNMLRFRKQLSEYFKDHPELSEKIKKKVYKKRALRKIVDEYNTWKNKNA